MISSMLLGRLHATIVARCSKRFDAPLLRLLLTWLTTFVTPWLTAVVMPRGAAAGSADSASTPASAGPAAAAGPTPMSDDGPAAEPAAEPAAAGGTPLTGGTPLHQWLARLRFYTMQVRDRT